MTIKTVAAAQKIRRVRVGDLPKGGGHYVVMYLPQGLPPELQLLLESTDEPWVDDAIRAVLYAAATGGELEQVFKQVSKRRLARMLDKINAAHRKALSTIAETVEREMVNEALERGYDNENQG